MSHFVNFRFFFFPWYKCPEYCLRDSIPIPQETETYFKELEADLKAQGSRLINTYREHSYIANFDYYYDIEDLTPKTWFRLEDVQEVGPYVVKGRTNSRKFQWDTQMYAEDLEGMEKIASFLWQDSLIGSQDIIIRKFVKLNVLETGINGLPFSN